MAEADEPSISGDLPQDTPSRRLQKEGRFLALQENAGQPTPTITRYGAGCRRDSSRPAECLHGIRWRTAGAAARAAAGQEELRQRRSGAAMLPPRLGGGIPLLRTQLSPEHEGDGEAAQTAKAI